MSELGFASEPAVAHGPEKAPLVAGLRLHCVGATRILLRMEQNDDVWTLRFPADGGHYPLLGFHPEGAAGITVQITNERSALTWEHKLVHQLKNVPASPHEFPPLEAHVSRPDRMAGRFTFLTVRRRAIGRVPDLSPAQRRFTVDWGMLIAIDNQGRMRWMCKLPKRVAGLERLGNGNLFVHDTESCSREIDMAGSTVNAWYAAKRPQGPVEGGIPVPVRSLHHQPHQMPNGNFLAVSAHSRQVRDWPASVHEPRECTADKEIVGDKVVEFTPTGEVVWSWDSFDHLDTHRIGYDALDAYWHVRGFPDAGDWTHGNGVTYDPEDDSVLLSLRLQDCILKIDRASGEIKWILGDHADWRPDLRPKLLTPVGKPFRWPWHMHNPRLTSEGTIVLFDNGIYGARPGQVRIPFHRSFSRGVEYRVREDDMTVEQVWSSAATDEDVKERTWAMGDAHRFDETDSAMVIHSIAMPHGRQDIGMDEDDRTLRHVSEFPSYARILEYDRKDISNILFDMTVRDPNDLIHWEVFSGVRANNLYPDRMGVEFEFGDGLESAPTTTRVVQ